MDHVTFTATATYDDPGTGTYDSEDKTVYFTWKRRARLSSARSAFHLRY
jgi:hypothetical protein